MGEPVYYSPELEAIDFVASIPPDVRARIKATDDYIIHVNADLTRRVLHALPLGAWLRDYQERTATR